MRNHKVILEVELSSARNDVRRAYARWEESARKAVVARANMDQARSLWDAMQSSPTREANATKQRWKNAVREAARASSDASQKKSILDDVQTRLTLLERENQ